MFISVQELFKIGIGPSSSHTMGPMLAAKEFAERAADVVLKEPATADFHFRCRLTGSLAFTGKGHGSDKAITMGLHGFAPAEVAGKDISALVNRLIAKPSVAIDRDRSICFCHETHIIFDHEMTFDEHPNGMIFELLGTDDTCHLSQVCFSVGGGFVMTREAMNETVRPDDRGSACPYPFESAEAMLQMSSDSGLTVAQLKRANELEFLSDSALNQSLDDIWQAMRRCIENGLDSHGILPGGLEVPRRAKMLYKKLHDEPATANVNEWLCAYAMAVNEENAAGNMVVTSPTNGAAGVIPAVIYYLAEHEDLTADQIREFLLTASAIGGLIKFRSSISGAEVGCQGEVGSASSMAAAGLCAVRGGTVAQIENAAEIALEHHLGMTCDPVKGLVQVPCIERNGFGAVKAFTAASIALRESGDHFMPLDSCIAAMRETGLEMSHKYKETSLGGLAVSIIEC